MPRYRKRPVEVEAIQYTGDNEPEIWEAFGAEVIYGSTETNPDHLVLTTTHGDPAPCRIGDWVVPDSRPGTFYPIKPDVFAATYEPVNPPPCLVQTLGGRPICARTFDQQVCTHCPDTTQEATPLHGPGSLPHGAVLDLCDDTCNNTQCPTGQQHERCDTTCTAPPCQVPTPDGPVCARTIDQQVCTHCPDTTQEP